MKVCIKYDNTKNINITVPIFLINMCINLLIMFIKLINKLSIIKDKRTKEIMSILNDINTKEFINSLKYLDRHYKDLLLLDIQSSNGDFIIIKV